MSDESLRISYSTAGDLKSSLIHVDDVKDLKLALTKVRTMLPVNKSKIRLIEQRIRQLTGCRFKGCKKKATTVQISTTIKRKYFNAIIAKTKTIEYRAATPYWEKRIEHRVVEAMTLICGRDVLTVGVKYVNRITTPKDLRAVVVTSECFAIYLDLNSLVVTHHEKESYGA